MVQHINNDKLLLGVLTNYADHLFEQKKYDSTYLISKRILHFASSQDIKNYKYSSLFLLSKVYAERQQRDSAYITNIESTENYNKIVNAEKISTKQNLSNTPVKNHCTSLFLSAFLNQFLGLKYDLYFLKSSLPTNNPPTQNNTSPIIREIVESVILVLASISRNGIIGMKRKNGMQRIIKIIPTFSFQFFFFILFMLADVGSSKNPLILSTAGQM